MDGILVKVIHAIFNQFNFDESFTKTRQIMMVWIQCSRPDRLVEIFSSICSPFWLNFNYNTAPARSPCSRSWWCSEKEKVMAGATSHRAEITFCATFDSCTRSRVSRVSTGISYSTNDEIESTRTHVMRVVLELPKHKCWAFSTFPRKMKLLCCFRGFWFSPQICLPKFRMCVSMASDTKPYIQIRCSYMSIYCM